MKKLLSVILLLALLASLLSFPAAALEYSGTCGDNVSWTLDTMSGVMRISGTGDITNVTWGYVKYDIKSVVIERGVTNICGFSNCSNLMRVYIPDTVTSIEEQAFSMIYPTVYYSGTNSEWEAVQVGNNNPCLNNPPHILVHHPASCGNGEPDSVGNIEYWSCTRCSELYSEADHRASTVSQSQITVTGGHDWGEWTVTTPAQPGVDGEQQRVCARCGETETETIPALPAGPAIVASGECGRDGDNLTWTLDGAGTLTITGTGAMRGYDWQYKNGVYQTTAPWGRNVNTVVIEPGVTEIGNSAFYGCSSLSSVSIPDSVTAIWDNAFGFCHSLRSIDIPDSVNTIGGSAFLRSGLTSVTIPNSVTEIETQAFYNCYSLESVTIPNSVIKIKSYAFSGSSVLRDVYFLGTKEEWERIVIEDNNNPLLNATVHYVTPCTVTIQADEGVELLVKNGDTVVSSGDTVPYGTVLTVEAAAKPGYALTVTPPASITVEEDVTVTAASERVGFVLTVNKKLGSGDEAPVDVLVAEKGGELTATAPAADGEYRFLGWYNPTGNLISRDAAYTTAMLYDQTIVARYLKESGSVLYVANGKIYLTSEADVTEEQVNAIAPMPKDGYEFVGWSMTVAEANAARANGNVTVEAQYQEKNLNITIKILNGDPAEEEIITCTKSQIITRTAKTVDNKVFTYWMDVATSNIYTYSRTVSFVATENMNDLTLQAVYADEEVEAKGTATMKSWSYNAATKKMTFVAYTTVPDGSKIVKAGLIASNSLPASGDLTLENAQYVKSTTEAIGTSRPVNYTWNKTKVNPGDTWYARAYVVYIYKGQTYKLYDDLVTATAG